MSHSKYSLSLPSVTGRVGEGSSQERPLAVGQSVDALGIRFVGIWKWEVGAYGPEGLSMRWVS